MQQATYEEWNVESDTRNFIYVLQGFRKQYILLAALVC